MVGQLNRQSLAVKSVGVLTGSWLLIAGELLLSFGSKGSSDLMLFPDAAIQILREARWSPDATRRYEILAGGFYWSDELIFDVARICVEAESWAFRFVVGYRSSLIRGVPRDELRKPWEQLQIECPNWPGFRQDRCGPSLIQELNREDQKACDDLDDLDRQIAAGT